MEKLNVMPNKEYILEILENILSIDSPTGFTNNVISYLEKECDKLNVKHSRNQKGNLIIEINNNSNYTIGLGAHVDTLGAMVRSINSNGTLKFTVLGGPILNTYDGEYCNVHTRSGKVYSGTMLSNSPAVHVYPNARTEARTDETMHVRLDEVTYSKNETKALGIETGDFIAVNPKFEYTSSGYIKSRFLDDKLSVAILFGVIKYLNDNNIKLDCNLKFVISTYEEVGHGSSNIPQMDEFIAVDMGCIGLDLNCTEQMVSICAKDSSGPYDYDMTTKLINLSKDNKLNYAVDVYPFYSSDVSAALRGGANIKGALIGSGVSASHGMERSHIDGVINTFKLIILYLTNYNK